MIKQTLKYGQVVRIHLNSQEDRNNLNSKVVRIHLNSEEARNNLNSEVEKNNLNDQQENGIIIAKGFLDPNAYYMQIDDLRKANNFRDSLFTILPRGTFELHDEYLKEKKIQNLSDLKSRIQNLDTLDFKVQTLEALESRVQTRDDLKSRVKALDDKKSRAQTEASQYYTTIQSRINEEILFGAEVVFKHQDSQRYLFGSYVCSEVAMDSFKLKLSPQLSSLTIFKLAPYQTYQKEGQIIQIEEPLIIVHEKTQCKLDFKKCPMFLDEMIKNDKDLKASQTESFNEKILKKPINIRGEAVISLNSDRQWKFQQHEQNGKFIPNELCFFIYSQDGSYLTSDGSRLILQEYKDNEYIPLDCVWELQFYENKYVIRSQISGSVITYIEQKDSTSSASIQEYKMQDEQHLQIQPAKSGNNEISFNMFVKIKFKDKELQKLDSQRSKTKKLTITESKVEEFYKQLGQEDLDYVQYNVGFSSKNSVHGFQIKRLNEDLKKDLLLITSSHEILKQFIDSLQSEKCESIINEKILTQVLKVIQKLIAYLLNCEKNDIDECENLPIPSRQLFMKDLKMVEIIFQIIFYFWHKPKNLFEHKNYEKEKLRKIWIHSYKLIEKMARNNSPVKLYISQWLKFFLVQAIEIDDEQIQVTLTELLNDNYYSIDKFIQKKTLNQLVNTLINTKNNNNDVQKKHLRIFSSIIICEGKPITKNQNKLLKNFFKPQNSDKKCYQFKFLFRQKDQKIQVQHLNQQWLTLKEFFENSKNEELQTWNYFLAYINLLSDICQNRNIQATDYVNENYQLSILCSILEDPETEQINAIDPFLKLIHSAFIDCSIFAPIRRIARVREWKIIEKKTNIIVTKAKLSEDQKKDYQTVLNFMEKFIIIKDFKEGEKTKQSQYFQTLYTVLQVLKTTIRQGQWSTIEDLKNKLLEPLFKIITFQQIQSEQKDQPLNNNEKNLIQIQLSQNLYQQPRKKRLIETNTENIIILKCKQMSCEILDIIIDMETNVRVSISTKHLKDMFEGKGEFKDEYKGIYKDEDQIQDKSMFTDEDQKNNNFDIKSTQILKEDEIPQQMKNKIPRKNVKAMNDNTIQKWKSIFKNLIEKRDLFKNFLQDIISNFAELSKYDNEILQTYSIKLLKRIYGYRTELIENFDKTLIVNTGFTYKLSVMSRTTRRKLLSFNDFNIVKLNLEKQSEYNIYLWVETKDFEKAGVIQDLCWLIECLKSGDEVPQDKVKISYDALYAENSLQQVYTEKEQNFKLHQSLIKCQDLHENILVFINIASSKMVNENSEVQKNKLIMKTLYVCFQFLTMLLWNHHENKQDLDFIRIIPNLNQYLKYNLYCIQFLRELFQNNKVLLFNESKISQIINEVVIQCNELNYDQYYKSQLIDFLRVLTIYNNKSIKINQNLIMAAMQNKNYKKIMILFDSNDSLFVEIEKLIDDYQKSYFKVLKKSNKKDENLYININSKLTYLFNYFQILVLLISNKNEINLGKCKQMHSHLYLIKLYQQTGQCWPLKLYLRAYINKLYYENKKDFIGIHQNLIEIDLENILNDLKDILELRESGCDYQKIKLKNPTRFSYLCSYFYMSLEENLKSLNSIFDTSQICESLLFFDELEDILKLNLEDSKQPLKLHCVLLEFGNVLLKIKQSWQSEMITNLIKVPMDVFCKIYRTFDLHILILRDVLSNPKLFTNVFIETKCIQKKYLNGNEIIQKDFNQTSQIDYQNILSQKYQELQQKWVKKYGKQQDPLNSNYIDELREILLDEVYDSVNIDNNQIKKYKKKKLEREYKDETKINMELNQRFRNLMEIFLTDNTIRVFQEEEFDSFCNGLEQIKYSDKLSPPTITLKEFIQNIIHLNLNHYDTLSQDIQIFFLKALEKIIRKSENKDNLELHNKIVKQQQNFLLECGAAELICKLLRIPNLELRQALTNSLISFGNAFLERGNTKCQNEIYQKLLNDSKNKILINYRQLIRRVSRAVYNNFKFRKSKPQEVFLNIGLCDNYDFYDDETSTISRLNPTQEDDIKEENIKEEFKNLLNKSFRFLQLLCENNNVKMKNFIRQQIETDLNPKIGSINFIELATSQLRVFCKAFNSKISEIPIYILDFILEVVQVPCLENQITLCKTTFFEDVCYLVQQLSIEKNQEQRGLKDSGMQSLFNIYNKIIIIIMSVLEGNDERIQEDLQKKIDPKFLIEIFKQYLQNHNPQIQRKEDMVKALEEQSLSKTQNQEAKQSYEDKQIQKKNDDITEKILNVLIIKEKIKFKNFQFDESSIYIQDIMKFLETKILKIEIIYDNKPQTILFPSHPLFTFLSGETRDMIMYNVNRDTQRDKINGLLEYRNQIYQELQYNYELSKREFLPITSQIIQVLRYLSALFSISVNILMILFYNMEILNFKVFLMAEFHEQLIINVLSFCQLLTTLIYYICYLNYRIPICIDKYKPLNNNSDDQINHEESDDSDDEQNNGLVEVPCLENQITLCKTTFFEDVCYLVQQLSIEKNQEQRGLKDSGMQSLFNIYNKIIIIIMSVLEGNDERIQEDLQKKIDPKFLIEIFKQYLQNHNPQIQRKEDMVKALEEQSLSKTQNQEAKQSYEDKQIQKKNDDITEKILNVLIIKEKIKFKNFQFDESSIYIQDIMKFLETKILKIEIIYDNKPQTILFPSHPLFTFLSGETRDMIMYNVNRDTQRDKINGLLEYRNQIYQELQYNYELSKREFLPITSQIIQVLRYLSALFSISVNILMILFYNMEILNFKVFLMAEFHEQLIINVLSFCQLLTTLIYYICYLNYRIPICIDKYKPLNNNSDDQINHEESDDSDDEQNNGLVEVQDLINQKDQNKQKNESKIQQFSHTLRYILDSAKKINQQNDDFIQITFYLVFSILGTFYKSYFFSLHLFDLISRLTLLNNVFQAISHNAKQLIVVSLLGVLFIYVFSFTSFDQYADDIYTEKQPQEHCETLISCMITLITSGVIGTSMSKWDFVKFCYDTLYFVFFALLFTNIISGIMIDTFAELRDQRQKIDDDKKNCCFICGVKRAQLEKNLEEFEQHVKDKHFLWNYIYYIYCLKLKETTDYTGLEYAISEMIRKDNISWFPIQIEQDANQDKEIDGRIAQLEGEMKEKDYRITQLEQDVNNKLNIINNILTSQLEKEIPSKLENLNFLISQIQSSKMSQQPILKQVSMNHNHTNFESETSDVERTTSFESSQLGRIIDISSYRRTSTSSKGDNNQSPRQQRRNSFVTFESNNTSTSLSQIKFINDPFQYLKMNDLQKRVWKALSKCTNTQLESVFLIDIIVLHNDTEFEFKFDLSQLSCFMTIKELREQINIIFSEQKNQKIQDPQLYILIGVIKTQKLDGDIRLFELLNILLYGKKTLILQSSCHNC
ncbi:unnamed protein product [Paramecium sonneborni]|uniref:MIR domain protein n=1 Tax=Paramecium sonneborni TaxID=65129 RepID=A0A8S1MKS7_9CILI|nr:unnamed protein product [Paramecium sonneborni]